MVGGLPRGRWLRDTGERVCNLPADLTLLPIRCVEEVRWRYSGNSDVLWPLLRRAQFLQYAEHWRSSLLRGFVFLCKREGVQHPKGVPVRGEFLYPGVQFVG